MKDRVTLGDLFNDLQHKLQLQWLLAEHQQDRPLEGDFPGAASQGLAGPLNCIHPNRIQVLGHTELVYFSDIESQFYDDIINKIFSAQPAALILADAIEVEDDLHERTRAEGVPLLQSPLPDNLLIDELLHYLSRALAERHTHHGVFMEVLGVGVLLTGGAAVGKSELALELLARGHRLVADDAPSFSRIAPDTLAGNCPSVLQDFLEVRGLGILNIRAMFGDSAIKREKPLQLIAELKPMSDKELKSIDRLKGSYSECEVLGLPIPKITLPVAPGREMAILVEAAVRQHTLRLKGYDGADDFIRRQQEAISGPPQS